MRLFPVHVFCILLLILFTPVSAQPYLVENQTWQGNLTGVAFSAQSFADIDNDGDLDLAMIGIGDVGIKSKIYINNGSSFYESSEWQQNMTNMNYGSIAFADIDNDGDLDLLLTGCTGSCHYAQVCNQNDIESFIFTNNGTSLVANATWYINIEKVWRSSIALGDIDNDGDLDLVLTGQTASDMVSKIYTNNGTSFVESVKWQENLIGIDSSSVAFGDTDNDGDLDLILSGRDSTYNKQTKIYTNNGTSFVENTTWQNNLIELKDSSVAFGDTDNDGDLDLSIIGCCDIHRTYNNSGTEFVEVQKEITHFAGVFAGSTSFGDYNNDGYLDIITTGREEYTSIYSNYGNGTFTDYWNRPEQQIMNMEYSYAVWGDIDNDYDLDLLLTGWGGGGGGQYQAIFYVNNITTKNNPPTAPSSFEDSYFNNKLNISWSYGSDMETISSSLYYYLRVGTC